MKTTANPSARQVFFAWVVWLALAATARGQVAPRIGYVYPAGGQAGTEFEIAIGGRGLVAPAAVDISGDGVKAEVIERLAPLTGKQSTELRDELQKLREKYTPADNTGAADAKKALWTEQDKERAAEIAKRLADSRRRMLNPALAETVVVRLTIDAGASPGRRELRLVARTGLSNPIAFFVGALPEVRETETAIAGDARMVPARRDNRAPENANQNDMVVTPPTVINGRIMPGDVDRYSFQAKEGQELVVIVAARELVPYLADAVPGWFQATLALYDADGGELAFVDDYRFNPDPVLHYRIPADGEYAVEIRDAIYRGRDDFVYRITLGELPFVTGIFPLGGKAGEKTTVNVTGWNLAKATLALDAAGEAPGTVPLSVQAGGRASNSVPFAVDALPECAEREPSDRPGEAQPVTLPIIVNGRVDRSGDEDAFSFTGAAGDVVVAEVVARRLNSPLDSTLTLTDAAGEQLAFNDDHEDKGAGLETHHADSRLSVTLPADGIYRVRVGDAQQRGGPEYAYRLRIGPPRPDFELRVAPSSISVRPRSSVAITVYALRRDGFDGAIDLALKDAPDGFSLSGARIPPGQNQVRLALTAPAGATDGILTLSLEGSATVAGEQITRPAVPADDMMQAFAYRHLVPADRLAVLVSGRANRGAPRILSATPVTIPVGGTARVNVGLPTETPAGKLHIELSEPPDGVSIREVAAIQGGTQIVLQNDPEKISPGLEGNLIFNVLLERPAAQGDNKPQADRPPVPLGILPAVPFRVVAE